MRHYSQFWIEVFFSISWLFHVQSLDNPIAIKHDSSQLICPEGRVSSLNKSNPTKHDSSFINLFLRNAFRNCCMYWVVFLPCVIPRIRWPIRHMPGFSLLNVAWLLWLGVSARELDCMEVARPAVEMSYTIFASTMAGIYGSLMAVTQAWIVEGSMFIWLPIRRIQTLCLLSGLWVQKFCFIWKKNLDKDSLHLMMQWWNV